MKEESKNSRLKVYIPLAIVIIIVLAGAWLWYRDYSMYITTDDAHVDADNVSVSAKIMGRIATIYANEGDLVKQGMLMADLDSTDLIAQRNQTSALKAQAQANLVQSEIRYKSDNISLKVLEINLDRASEDMARAKKQSDGGVITTEQFDHIKKTFETASAQLEAAKGQLLVSKAMISSASASVESADAQIKVLEAQLKNTKLHAPAGGVVAKRWLLAGDVVQPSQSVFTITESSNLWVVAFLEETKMSEIHAGQKAKFTLDAFPDVKFTGKIFLVGSSTASVFSLIPANNASGNFTKVTQRIPVRISIETASNNKEVSSFNILSGMSAVVKILKN
jgi:membrane fusion protein (multidrug efflux system)